MTHGAHVGRIIKWNHPSHPHPLTLLDAQNTYRAYEGKWRCDVCRRVYDAKRPPTAYSDSEEPDHRHFYHCSQCNFDVCRACFKGHIHTFHHHRLKKARTTIVYPDPDALWRCDACKVVHSEHTDQLCYHCQKCEVDLCSTCFRGEWSHVLHSSMRDSQEHTLKPMDPRIEYRTYQEWMCDNCNRLFSCQSKDTAFHCSKCNFDLCETCFSGEKHHLHPHPLVSIQAKDNSTLECSNCEMPIRQMTHYCCRRPSCQYLLCVNCYAKQPQLHPCHSHPLHVCDPLVEYPQSGGMWHCDQCTSNSINRQPVPLSYTETMYHCDKCEFDLCHSCYSERLSSHNSMQEDVLRPVQVAEEASYNTTPETSDFTYSSGYGTYQPTTYYTSEDYRSRLSRPLVTGMQASLHFLPPLQVPSHKLCIVCRRSEATTTFMHGGTPHSGHPLCCSSCATDIVSNRRPCPACRIPPDNIFHLQVHSVT